ncbi:MAG: DUF1810 domain-containing protein [Rhodothermales bacterium]
MQRFVDAQAPCYDAALRELRAGEKRTHWMWFVFPQLRGLGRSAMAQRYAIGSAGEARAYWAHPVLGARLRDCTEAVLGVKDRSAHRIFGFPDDLKFRSCMTLFDRATSEALFTEALVRYFAGEPDPQTIAGLQAVE